MGDDVVRACRCGRPMERISALGDVINPGGYVSMCAHCDQPCERPTSICLLCQAILPERSR